MTNNGKNKTSAALRAFQITAIVFGCVSGALAEPSPKEMTSDRPMVSLEKVSMGSMLNLDQQYRIDIYPDLTVVFHGLVNTRVKGEAHGKISRDQLVKIHSGFSDVRFFELDPVYGHERRDPRRAVEGEQLYTLTFRVRKADHTVQVSTIVPAGTPPGIRLLIDRIKRLSGARQWACPILVTPSLGGEPIEVCEFPE